MGWYCCSRRCGHGRHCRYGGCCGGGVFGPEVTGAQVEAQSALRISPGGASGQWGEGAYAFPGTVGQSANGSSFQFRVPPQTAVETVTIPGKSNLIIRLVPPPGQSTVPIQITGTDFAPGALQQGRQLMLGMNLGRSTATFGYPGISADVSGLSGALGGTGSIFSGPTLLPPTDPNVTDPDHQPWTLNFAVGF